MNYGPPTPFLGLAVVFWLIWLGVMIAALVAFFRGMRALTQIAERMERIERILEGRTVSETGRAT